MTKILITPLLFVTFLYVTPIANAQTTWTDGTGDHLWQTGGNWNNGTPGSGDDAFVNTAGLAGMVDVKVTSNAQANSLNFVGGDTTPPTSLNVESLLAIGSGGLFFDSETLEIDTAPGGRITVAGDATIGSSTNVINSNSTTENALEVSGTLTFAFDEFTHVFGETFHINTIGTGTAGTIQAGDFILGESFVDKDSTVNVSETTGNGLILGTSSAPSSGSAYVGQSFTVNQGTLNVANKTVISASGSLAGNGSSAKILLDDVDLDGGQLLLTSGSDVTVSGTLNVTGGQIVVAETSNLIANIFALGVTSGGTLDLSGAVDGDLTQSGGKLAPGMSIGTATINGNYDLNSGTLEMELMGTGGEEFDHLNVTGDFNISPGAELEVILLGYVPVLGDQFDLWDVGLTTPLNFDTFNLPGLSIGLDWDTSSLGNDGVLSVVAVPEPSSVAIVALLATTGLVRRRRHR